MDEKCHPLSTFPSPLGSFMKDLVKGVDALLLEDDNAKQESIPDSFVMPLLDSNPEIISPSQQRFKASSGLMIGELSPSLPLRTLQPSTSGEKSEPYVSLARYDNRIDPDFFNIGQEHLEGPGRQSRLDVPLEEEDLPHSPMYLSTDRTPPEREFYQSLDDILVPPSANMLEADDSSGESGRRKVLQRVSSMPVDSGRKIGGRNETTSSEDSRSGRRDSSRLIQQQRVKLTRSRTVRSTGNFIGRRKGTVKDGNARETRRTHQERHPRQLLDTTSNSGGRCQASQPERKVSQEKIESLEEMVKRESSTKWPIHTFPTSAKDLFSPTKVGGRDHPIALPARIQVSPAQGAHKSIGELVSEIVCDNEKKTSERDSGDDLLGPPISLFSMGNRGTFSRFPSSQHVTNYHGFHQGLDDDHHLASTLKRNSPSGVGGLLLGDSYSCRISPNSCTAQPPGTNWGATSSDIEMGKVEIKIALANDVLPPPPILEEESKRKEGRFVLEGEQEECCISSFKGTKKRPTGSY